MSCAIARHGRITESRSSWRDYRQFELQSHFHLSTSHLQETDVSPHAELLTTAQVTIRDLDPKSISTQELYGYVNMSTREWKDGLLSYNMRELANQPDDNPKWILLDGDLDANW